MRRRRQQEPTECDAAPETSCDVTDRAVAHMARVHQESVHPAGDTNFGALVGEDEQRAKKHDTVRESRKHGRDVSTPVTTGSGSNSRDPRRLAIAPTGRVVQVQLGIPLIIPKRTGTTHPSQSRQPQAQRIVPAPNHTENRHHGRRQQRPDSTADTIRAVHHAQGRGGVTERSTEHVAHSQVDGHAEPDKEERNDDRGIRSGGDHGDVAQRDEALSDSQSLGAPEPFADGVDEEGAGDEAEGVADED